MNIHREVQKPLTDLEKEYIEGFEHGCDYLFNEVRRWDTLGRGTLADFVTYIEQLNQNLKRTH